MTIARDLYLINEDCKARTSELRNERIRLIKIRIKEIGSNETSSHSGTSTGYDLRGKNVRQTFCFISITGLMLIQVGRLLVGREDSGVDSELEESTADEQLARLFESPSGRKDPANLTPDPTRMPFGPLHGPSTGSDMNNGHFDLSNRSQFRHGRPLISDESDSPSNVSSLSEPLAPLPSSEQIFGRINELKQRFKEEQDQVRRQQQFSQAKVAQSLKDKLMERRHRRSRAQMHEREAAALTLDSLA